MYCPYCGTKLPDGSRFCSACGKRIESIIQDDLEEDSWEGWKDAYRGTQSDHFGRSSAQKTPVQIRGSAENRANRKRSGTARGRRKRGRKKWIAVIATVIIALMVCAVFGWKIKLFRSYDRDAFICISNGQYEMIPDLKTGSTIDIASTESDTAYSDFLRFSPDGRYIYYFTNVIFYEDVTTGTLCRAEYGKLKGDSSENAKFIQKIDDNVIFRFNFLKDNAIAYEKYAPEQGSALYYFDGRESVLLAESSYDCHVNDAGDKIIYSYSIYDPDITAETYRGYDLYGVSVDDIENPVILASHVTGIVNQVTDFENILVTEREDDGTDDLYVVGFQKGEKKIAENADIVNYGSGPRIYYTVENGKKFSLNGSVEDADAGNGYPVKTLYCFANGAVTVVNDTVLDAEEWGTMVIYNTEDMFSGKDSNENLVSAEGGEDLFSVNDADENYIILPDGTSCKMSADAAVTYGSAKAGLSFADNEVYMNDTNDNLYMAEVHDGVVYDFSVIDENAPIIEIADSTLYYQKNIHTRNNYDYFDLYSCKDGITTCLAEDITCWSAVLYSDGVLFVDMNFNSETGYPDESGYELTMIDSQGEKTRIADHVTRYIRIAKSGLLYISEGDLYFYDGKDTQMVKPDVRQVWSRNCMDGIEGIDNEWGLYLFNGNKPRSNQY